MLARGPKHLIIKRGEYGVLMFNEKQVFGAPAFPLEDVRDPTGAGDTFAGGFLGYLAATGNSFGRVLQTSHRLRERHGLIYRRSL